MTHWTAAALAILRQNDAAAMITVADVSGSAPREAGTRMIVTPDRQWGTIGGGNLEFQAVSQARALLENTGTDCCVNDYPLGPQLGQCCGGFVRVLTSKLDKKDLGWLEQLDGSLAKGRPVRFEMALGSGPSIRYSLAEGVDANGEAPLFQSTIETGSPSRDKAQTIVELIAPPSASILLFGAGHVGQAVARILGSLPVSVIWIDGRADYVPATTSENTVFRLTGRLVEEVMAAPKGGLFLVFTHSHDLDFEVVKAVLLRDDFRYCGLIGSRTKRASFERRLRDEGVPERSVGRLVCPIGMTTLKSKDPSVIAVGVVAELLTYIDAGGRA